MFWCPITGLKIGTSQLEFTVDVMSLIWLIWTTDTGFRFGQNATFLETIHVVVKQYGCFFYQHQTCQIAQPNANCSG